MNRTRITWLRFLAASSDGIALGLLWALVSYIRAQVTGSWLHDFSLLAHLQLIGLVIPVWIAVLYTRGSYAALRRKDPSTVASALVISNCMAVVATLAVLFLFKFDHVSRAVVAGFTAFSLPTLVASRWIQLYAVQHLRTGEFDPHRVLLVGADGEADPFQEGVKKHPEWGITIVGQCEVSAIESSMTRLPIDEVYLTGAGLGFDTLQLIAAMCDERGVRLSMDANFLSVRTAQAELVDFNGWSVLSFTSTPTLGAELAAKRVLDITIAAAGLVILSPILTGIALAIRYQDGGPALFSQERSGHYGRSFRMFKFRTMVVDAEAQLEGLRAYNQADGPVFKMTDDPRLTPIGAWLRRTSIDELPQLWNILLGEMSLVGPRPPLPDEVRMYERWQLRRLSMKPGLTCIWQVSGRSNLSWERWMELDLQYIDTWSLSLDLRLLLRTVPAVIGGEGAR